MSVNTRIIDQLRGAIAEHKTGLHEVRRRIAEAVDAEGFFSTFAIARIAESSAHAETIAMMEAVVKHVDEAIAKTRALPEEAHLVEFEAERWVEILSKQLERSIFNYGGGSSTSAISNEVARLEHTYHLRILRMLRTGL